MTLQNSIAAVLLFLCCCLNAQPLIRINRESGYKFRPINNSTLDIGTDDVRITSKFADAGIFIDGPWDLSKYRALQFKVKNEDSGHVLQICSEVMDSTCTQHSFGRWLAYGKAEYTTTLFPGESKTVTLYLPAPLPHPEINRIFYDNFIYRRLRNTPYSFGYKMNSYDVNLAKVCTLGIGIRAAFPGVKFTVSEIQFVPGEKKKLPAWMNLDKEHFFPFIDRYGQFKHADWPGKVKSDNDLVRALAAEEKDLARNPEPEEWSKFGGWKNGGRYDATGSFYVKKIDGKWWMIDPEGHLFWSHGAVRVTPSSAVTPLDGHKFYFENLPPEQDDPFSQFYHTRDELLYPYYVVRGIRETYDFSCANLYRKYGKDYKAKWYDLAHKRLRSWGLNTIANSSDHALCLMDRTAYNDRVDLAAPVEGYPEWPIFEGARGIWDFIDPFDELFETCVRAHLEAVKHELDDPWCLGFFVDNEIKWGKPENMGSLAFKAAPNSASKKVLINSLLEKYHSIAALNEAWCSAYTSWNDLYENRQDPPAKSKNDMCDFSLKIIEQYFSTVRRVFKQIAPNKLYMGCRFASHPEYVVRICAKYVDVISYNRYAFDQSDFTLPKGIDIPMMIGEFHFGAMDRGLFGTGIMSVDNQQQRAEIYRRYMRSCLENPCIIGTNWHQFSDQATSGRFDGENFQVGLTDICDTPYAETIQALRQIGSEMYRIRSGR